MLKGNWAGVSSQLRRISRRRRIVNPDQARSLSCGGAVRPEGGRHKWKQPPLIKPQIPQIQGGECASVTGMEGGFCLLQNEALNLGFKCQRPDILGRADPAVRHGLMSPFIFITYFYPRAPSPRPASRNLEFGCGVRGGWAPCRLLLGGATLAGLCRGSAHFPKQCKLMGRCYEGSGEPAKGGGNRLDVHGFLSASRVRTGSQRCAKLKTVSILGNARACLTTPRPAGQEVIPALSPDTAGRTLGDTQR